MKRGLTAAVSFERIQRPYVRTYPGARHAVLILADVRPETRVLIAPLADVVANKAHWTAVAGFEDEVTGVEIDRDSLYLLANKGTPRGRILRAPRGSPPPWPRRQELVPQSARVIESLDRAKDGLYLKIMDGGISRLQRMRWDGQVEEIALPFDGTLSALETAAGRRRRVVFVPGLADAVGLSGRPTPMDTSRPPASPLSRP